MRTAPAYSLPVASLGRIVLDTYGPAACWQVYRTSLPETVGRAALDAGHIRPDGVLN